MKKYLIPTALLLVTALSSCTKTIDEDLSGNERSLLELRVEGQMGTAIIDRDGSRATATVRSSSAHGASSMSSWRATSGSAASATELGRRSSAAANSAPTDFPNTTTG